VVLAAVRAVLASVRAVPSSIVIAQVFTEPFTSSSYWMYSILINDDFGLSRDEVMAKLKAAGIETRSFFVSMHRQPALAKYGCDVSGSYPVTDLLARTGLYLPSTSGLTDAQIARVASELLALRAG